MSERLNIKRIVWLLFLLLVVASLALAIFFAAVNYTALRDGLLVFNRTIHDNEQQWEDVRIGDQPAWLFAKTLSANRAIFAEAVFWSALFLVLLVLLLWRPSRKAKETDVK
jgi:hypothetical protein